MNTNMGNSFLCKKKGGGGRRRNFTSEKMGLLKSCEVGEGKRCISDMHSLMQEIEGIGQHQIKKVAVRLLRRHITDMLPLNNATCCRRGHRVSV